MAAAAESLAQILTVLITTSPASDHPRTELIEHVLASFRFVAGLADCRTIVVCDGYKVASSCNFRGGKVDEVRRANYEGYKEALRIKIAARHAGWGSIELLELQEHYGFGFAVREALALVKTDYVCVVQHDRTFMCVEFLRVCMQEIAIDTHDCYPLLNPGGRWIWQGYSGE